MKCESVVELLSSYWDGELAAVQRQEVEWHLQTCEGCRNAVLEISALSSRFERAFEEVWVPIHLTARIMDGLARRHRAAQARRLSLLYLVFAIAAAAALTLVLVSPVGVFLRVVVHLLVAAAHGGLRISARFGGAWLRILSTTSVVFGVAAVFGIARVLRKAQSEAIS